MLVNFDLTRDACKALFATKVIDTPLLGTSKLHQARTMQASKSSPPVLRKKDDGEEDITVDLYPFIREYKGGSVERLLHSPFVAASEDPADNRGVATRDVVVDKSTDVSARLFLPSVAAASAGERIPVVMYVHGGSFCTESAFSRTYHNYIRSLAARAGALVVSVEYNLAPEHPVPAAYDDAWAALQWVATLSDPWISNYADLGRTFLAGDSAGGNIVYNTAVRAASGGGSRIYIEGLVIVHPYFWGTDRLSSSEAVWDGIAMFAPEAIDRLWPFATAGRLGNDDRRVNPLDEDIASLRCRRVLVAVADKDTLRDRGRRLASRMRDCCSWADDENAVTLVESEGEDHGFHLYNPLRATSKILMESIVRFINQRTAPLPLQLPQVQELLACQGKMHRAVQPVLRVPTRPYMDVHGYGTAMKARDAATRTSCLHIGHGRRASKTSYGSVLGHVIRPNSTNMRFASSAITAPCSCVFHNFI
ncbi:probable carboxylesterase 5 [Hordeum vulgare subsp. vulgare]|uniref:Alpha/beta hydrolase fold-3 domain-containing protein n=1 Tax=Hordeum vulgare subsp. vulgare TaxID=112509 RepID=A0A8I6WPI0_HORVV|nr:probable carboxylesterase 5 [Hordeum vulgare subsp. vulgare]XP_044969082.1 probable carboxylesterase 5 [Hordeum vulgare subsp. vulgare]XP_044969084.1 probable carboxylesterase 5 [Hordeum vulgare subsp. vulgare]XP_044969087.1 probable carboxylesterase 5 [Hordeum vulgare subsp. vulgare]XP_044969089.1 probable carboxylesterase 5 [Hordeum vulgare subsp. vulgare]XP_044969091.1 probable carboxylesterase 5 [Hordeum vulgare subsp. vulgare]XP_044969093.1 probable carboxylesterase 5 [Hordeum vulgare